MMITKNRYTPALLLLAMVFILSGCSGIFTTDKTLSKEYLLEVGDREITVYIKPMQTTMKVAVKNVGYSFMTSLQVGFECVKDGQTVTEIYNVGNLKPYFSKDFIVPLSYYTCRSLRANYYFLPASDGGSAMYTERNFINPVNPVENSFKIK